MKTTPGRGPEQKGQGSKSRSEAGRERSRTGGTLRRGHGRHRTEKHPRDSQTDLAGGAAGNVWHQSDLRLGMGVGGDRGSALRKASVRPCGAGSSRQGCREVGSEESLKADGSPRDRDCDGGSKRRHEARRGVCSVRTHVHLEEILLTVLRRKAQVFADTSGEQAGMCQHCKPGFPANVACPR